MLIFNNTLPSQSPEQKKITDYYYADESHCIQALAEKLSVLANHDHDIEKIAIDLVNTVRSDKKSQTHIEALMSEYDLSSDEGIVLMCLAESLLRIPDRETEDLLIKDKLTSGEWEKHLGASESRFVNLTTRSLPRGGKVLADQSESNIFKKI